MWNASPARNGAGRAALTTPEGERRPMDEDGRIVIEDPQLWWPAGYGEQPLYQVCVTVDAPDGPQQWKRRIGLRTRPSPGRRISGARNSAISSTG